VQVVLDAQRTHVVPAIPGVTYRWLETDGDRLLVFDVGPSMVVHQLTDGRYVMRQDDQNLPFRADAIEAIKSARQQTAADAVFVREAGMADIDADLVAEFAKRIGSRLSTGDLLLHFRLAEKLNGGLVLRLAALLLFGKDPIRWHPVCYIDFVKWAGTKREFGADLNVVNRQRVEGPLPTLIQSAFDVIRPHVRERQQLVDLLFEEKYEYPTFAWQEAIINAIAHRDYTLRGTPVEVWLFDDHMEVRSPGAPIPPVTIESLQRSEPVHASRNPLLVRVLTEWGQMRELGEGIPRMFQVMEQEGLNPPEFRLDAGGIFTVSFYNTVVYPPEILGRLQELQGLGLSRNQCRLLAYAHAHGGTFTSRQYQQLTGVDVYTAQHDIRQLLSHHIAILPRKGGRVYHLVVSPEEQPKSELEQRYEQLLPEMEQVGFLTNASVRKAIGLSRSGATRLLQDWVDAGIVIKRGSHRGTKYLPSDETDS
jgi:ATP-dependent DNA helicase RecG